MINRDMKRYSASLIIMKYKGISRYHLVPIKMSIKKISNNKCL